MLNHEATNHSDKVTANPEILGGKPVIAGTRIGVEHILEQLADSLDLREFFEVYPDLTPGDIQAALEYARALVAGERVSPPLVTHASSAARRRKA